MKYCGGETKKAIENFGSGRTPDELISAYALVKKSALYAIQTSENYFTKDEFASLIKAADEVSSGIHCGCFTLPLKQGGAGTSINMNVNEVIALRAGEIMKDQYGIEKIFSATDDVNRYQSTNDTFPTAVTILMLRQLESAENCVINLQHALKDFENKYHDVMITGRTEMQSALPMTLAQCVAAWTGAIERDRWRLHKLKERLRTIALGGSAIGTSFPATRDYIFACEKYLREFTGLNLSRSQNLTDEISSQDKFAELACALKILSGNVYRISSDINLYASSMLGEFIHPEFQFGSSIMAAKTNPVFLEYACGCAIDASFECDKAARFCELTALQLNPYLPFICESLLKAFDGVKKAASSLSEKLVPNLKIDRAKTEENLYSSNAPINLMLPALSYEKVKELYRRREGVVFRNKGDFIEFIRANTSLEKDEIEYMLDPVNATNARRKNK